MSSSIENSIKVPINVTFYTPSRIVGKKSFEAKVTFKEILDHFTKEILPKDNESSRLYQNYSLDNKKLEKNDSLLSQIPKEILPKITEMNFAIELKENLIIDRTPKLSTIIKPKLNPFGLIVYSHFNNIIKYEEYPEKFIKKYELDTINEYTSYCNTEKYLFLSGGKKRSFTPHDF